MEIICRARQQGKTTDLIKIAAKHFSYIICCSRPEAHRIFKLALNMGLDIPFPITISEFLDRQFYAKGIKSFAIDEVGFLLDRLAQGINISAITLTDETQDNE